MFCPVPHTLREKSWLSIGLAVGLGVGYYALKKSEPKRSAPSKPCVLPAPKCVVDVPGKILILEHAGNGSNGDPNVSIASVAIAVACDEATQVPQFDEYVMILTGTMKVFVGSEDQAKRPPGRETDAPFELTAHGGEVLHLPKGHLYRYNFPGACTYIPICLPAFAPHLSGRIE